jgi:hypothetical protein
LDGGGVVRDQGGDVLLADKNETTTRGLHEGETTTSYTRSHTTAARTILVRVHGNIGRGHEVEPRERKFAAGGLLTAYGLV